jgi:hypothetical protein
MKSFLSINHLRPPKLIIQVDNCSKDGKNKIVFAFAAHLVYWGWFKEVHIISLIQGHTHDLIDGEFAIWTIGEKKFSIKSFFGLEEFILHSFKKEEKKVQFSIIRTVYNWNEYFTPVLVSIKKYSDARIFKIFKNENNQVVMMYKTNTTEEEWLEFLPTGSKKQLGIQICKKYLSFCPSIIPPQPLDTKILETISSNNCFTKFYSPQDLSFWKKLNENSIGYLTDKNLFKGEGKYNFLRSSLWSTLFL